MIRNLNNWLINNKNMIFRFVILVVPSVIFWFLLYPGYFQADHQGTIADIANGTPTEWHSLVWGYLAFPFIYFSSSYAIYGLIQIMIFALFINFGIGRLNNAGILQNAWFLTCLMALFPTYLMYNLLYSSDIVFAYSLFPITCLYIEYIVCYKATNENMTWKSHKNYFAWLLFFTVFMCLMRKNAIIIPIVSILIVLISKFNYRIRFIIINLLGVASIFIFSFFFCNILGAKPSPSQEFLGIPCNQISAVYNQGGYISDDCAKVFESIKSKEKWSNAYHPYSADDAKDGVEFSLDFLISYIKTGINNPFIYLKAYYKLECAYWEFGMTNMYEMAGVNTGIHRDFYEQNLIPEFTTDHTYNFNPNDEIANNYLSQFDHGERYSSFWYYPYKAYVRLNETNFANLKIILNDILFNRALPFWTFLICLIISLKNRRTRDYLFVSTPIFSILLSYLLSAPMPLMRYSAMLYYALPLLIVFVYIQYKEKKTLKSAKNSKN